MAQSVRNWNISLGGDRQVLHIMICYGGECTVRVKYVPTEQSFSNDYSHCLIPRVTFLELAMSLLDFAHRIPLGTFSISLVIVKNKI